MIACSYCGRLPKDAVGDPCFFCRKLVAVPESGPHDIAMRSGTWECRACGAKLSMLDVGARPKRFEAPEVALARVFAEVHGERCAKR